MSPDSPRERRRFYLELLETLGAVGGIVTLYRQARGLPPGRMPVDGADVPTMIDAILAHEFPEDARDESTRARESRDGPD